MILMVLRLALTVPSLPRPKNTACRDARSASVWRSASHSRLVPPTSSWMPIVTSCRGSGRAGYLEKVWADESGRVVVVDDPLPNIAATMPGVNSFDDRP